MSRDSLRILLMFCLDTLNNLLGTSYEDGCSPHDPILEERQIRWIAIWATELAMQAIRNPVTYSNQHKKVSCSKLTQLN